MPNGEPLLDDIGMGNGHAVAVAKLSQRLFMLKLARRVLFLHRHLHDIKGRMQ